jgi:fatty acid desaturase
MVNNLEHISYLLVKAPDGKTYAQLRKELKPSYLKPALDIAKGYLFLLLILLAAALLIRNNLSHFWVVVPISAILTGYVLAYLHLFIHAASHYDLSPNKKRNDLYSNMFLGVLFGINIHNYRKIHWQHHLRLGTKTDTEHTYFNELNFGFILKTISGYRTIEVILSRLQTTKNNPRAKASVGFHIYCILFHTALCGMLYLCAGWQLLLIWVLALVFVFPFFGSLRQLLEHRDKKADGHTNYASTDHGKISRLFGKNLIDRSFGAAGFNRHLLHHWDPVLSYTCLEAAEGFLTNCPETARVIAESKTTYIKTFLLLFIP